MDKQQDWITEALAHLPPVCTTEEVISILRVTPRHVYRLIALGRLQSVKSSEKGGARRLIPKTALATYLRSLDGGQ